MKTAKEKLKAAESAEKKAAAAEKNRAFASERPRPNSNRNSAGEFVRVRGNWFAGEIHCPLTRCEVGSYHPLHIIAFLHFFLSSYC